MDTQVIIVGAGPVGLTLAIDLDASLGYRAWLAEVRPEIGDDTPSGAAARAHLAEVANVEQRKSNEMIGAELGYRYVDSPIIDNVPGGPQHDLRAYLPTAWPGARLPHMWLCARR